MEFLSEIYKNKMRSFKWETRSDEIDINLWENKKKKWLHAFAISFIYAG